MKTIIVTGAAGFIGRHVAKHCAAQGAYVVGIGHSPVGDWHPDSWGIANWKAGSITTETLRSLQITPDAIFHCAGGGSVGYSIQYPRQDFERSVESTSQVLEFIRQTNRETAIVIPSSAAVYGCSSLQPIAEECALNPISPYGFHKKMSEDLAVYYASNFEINAAIVRLFSIYGQGIKKQILWDSCVKIDRGERVFQGTGNEVRDFLHVSDAADLLYKCAAIASYRCPVINGGSGKGVTVREVLDLVSCALGKSCEIEFTGLSRAGDPPVLLADSIKARSLGWDPTTETAVGIKSYVRWYKAQHL